MSDDKATLVESRLLQARESLKEADVLLREGMSKRSVMKMETLAFKIIIQNQ